MKGKLKFTAVVVCLATFVFPGWTGVLNAQDLVINELNWVTGPDNGQFVELYGEPGLDLSGHSVVFVRPVFQSANVYEAQVDFVVGLDGQSLDADGFALVDGLSLIGNVVGVVLAASPAGDFVEGEAAMFEDVVDAILYGNLGLTHPQMSPLVASINPLAMGALNESGDGVFPGTDGFARVPDGGEPMDQMFVLQANSPGTTNVLPCEGGTLSLNNPNNSTVCTDLGAVIFGFTHESDASSAATTLVVVDDAGEVVNVFPGTAINMEGLGDGTYMVHAVSHDSPLTQGWTTLDDVATVDEDGCAQLAVEPVEIVGETCEIPSCDGGTVLTAGGDVEAEACLTAEGALVAFGYYSDAVEGEYLFLVCDTANAILATTEEPYFDFAVFGEAGNYNVWGLSYQNELDTTTLAVGSPVDGVAPLSDCDSLSVNALPVAILDCGAGGLCDDLIISEYVEGTSQNKAFEIHNPTSEVVDLTPYALERYNNGSQEAVLPSGESLDLQGTLAPGEVYVVANSEAAGPIVSVADTLSTVTWVNGNDALVLRKNGEIIDQMGIIGEDPMGSWAVGEGAMSEYTLVRKPNIGQGSTDWSEGQTQWDVYPQDTFDFLGDHTASCGGLGSMVVGFAAPELYVSEGGGVEVEMTVSYPLDDVQVEISVSGGDAVSGFDFPGVFPLNFTFESGLLNSQSFNFVAIDDEEPELQEDVELTMTVTSGAATLGIQTVVVHILPSDLTYPVYDIIQVRGTDNQGVLDSIDTACELRGIVHGWNDYPQGLRFTLIDETHGINVFSAVNNYGYDVLEGDSVRVRGVVGQYQGLATIYADTVIYEGSGFPTQAPIQVQEMDEDTESRVVKLKCVRLEDPDEWTNTPPYFDVLVDYGAGQVQIRIDANTDIFGEEPPLGTFGVTGIGGQADNGAPYLDGYTLLPRSLEDLTPPVLAAFDLPDVISVGGSPVFVENESQNAEAYQWSFGNGDFSTEESPELTYTEGGEYTVFLTASNLSTGCSDQTSATVEVELGDAVVESAALNMELFPNPASDVVRCRLNGPSDYVVLDVAGRTMDLGQWSKGTQQLDVSKWPQGVYTLRCTTDAGSVQVARFAVKR